MTDLIGDRAVASIDAYAAGVTQRRQPFFLDVHLNAPHWPWEALGDEAESERMRTAALRDLDGGTQRTYVAMVERMDYQIGRILNALDTHGLSANTIVVFTREAPPSPRQLFWQYKANSQRAARDGDWKFLKIGGSTFLFDVAADPMERANLRDRHRDVFDSMVVEWNAWDAAMLPEIRESFTEGFTARQLADHIGATTVPPAPDTDPSWPTQRSTSGVPRQVEPRQHTKLHGSS